MLPVDVTLLAAAHDLAVLFGRSLGIQNPVSFHAERNGVLKSAVKSCIGPRPMVKYPKTFKGRF